MVMNAAFSKPTIDAIDRGDDLPPALGADGSTPIHQIGFLNCVEQVTFAKRRPIEAVAGIENHLVRLWLPGGSSRGAYSDFLIWMGNTG
jgi:hypothetical protein